MKSMKPSFYVVILVVFLALLYVVYIYNNTTDGFENKEIMAHFQNMPPEQKDMVCKALLEQIASYTEQMVKATPEQKQTMMKELEPLKKTSSSYGC